MKATRTPKKSPSYSPPHKAHTAFGAKARHRKGDDPSNVWLTPVWLINLIKCIFYGVIDLDPCTEANNPVGAKRFYTVRQNGLKKSWGGHRSGIVFVNPPYSTMSEWAAKIQAEAAVGARIIALLPVRTDAAYHQKLLLAANEILLIDGRVHFTRTDGTSGSSPAFGSMLLSFNTSIRGLADLGVLVMPTGFKGGVK